MSLAEASGLVGVPVVSSKPLPSDSGCTYDMDDPDALVAFEFVDETYWTKFKALEPQPPASTVGDESAYSDEGGLLILAVRKGSTYFSVAVRAPAGAHPDLDIANGVARIVVARGP
jgi:hypothetical protein